MRIIRIAFVVLVSVVLFSYKGYTEELSLEQINEVAYLLGTTFDVNQDNNFTEEDVDLVIASYKQYKIFVTDNIIIPDDTHMIFGESNQDLDNFLGETKTFMHILHSGAYSSMQRIFDIMQSDGVNDLLQDSLVHEWLKVISKLDIDPKTIFIRTVEEKYSVVFPLLIGFIKEQISVGEKNQYDQWVSELIATNSGFLYFTETPEQNSERVSLVQQMWSSNKVLISYYSKSFRNLPVSFFEAEYLEHIIQLQSALSSFSVGYPPYIVSNSHLLNVWYVDPMQSRAGGNYIIAHNMSIEIPWHEMAHIIQRNGADLSSDFDIYYEYFESLYSTSSDDEGGNTFLQVGDFFSPYHPRVNEDFAEGFMLMGKDTKAVLEHALERALDNKPKLLEKVLVIDSVFPKEDNRLAMYYYDKANAMLEISYIPIMRDDFGRITNLKFDGYFYQINYNPNSNFPDVALVDSKIMLMTCDFNLDGWVSLEDFAIIRSNYGLAEGATRLTGDTNRDGRVDNVDYSNFVSQFGGMSLPSTGNRMLHDQDGNLVIKIFTDDGHKIIYVYEGGLFTKADVEASGIYNPDVDFIVDYTAAPPAAEPAESFEEPIIDEPAIQGDQEVVARLETQEESAAKRNTSKLTYYNELRSKSKYLDWLKN